MEKVLSEDVSVIILAGGKGARTGLDIPKQFVELRGKRIIEHTIDAFINFASKVIVVVPETTEWSEYDDNDKVIIAKGGETRTDSLLNGLAEADTKYTLIHDANRPLVEKDVVHRVVDALEAGASCAYPVLTIASSIVIDHEDTLQATPERDRFREIQTPQGFVTDDLKQAINEFSDQHIHIPELIRWLGKTVAHVEGSPWLFKITYEPDIYAANKYFELYEDKEN